ncbi:CRISPR-associated protein Cse2 [Castellaniella caeni]
MSEPKRAQAFINRLRRLNGEPAAGAASSDTPPRHAGAMAALRHSLAFDPGTYLKAFPYVEPFFAGESACSNVHRKAYYVVAGLYALHPVQSDQPFATSLARLALSRARKGGSAEGVETRLMALLGAQAENIPQYLRQLMALLASEGEGCDYVALLDDLCLWMNPAAPSERLDHVRQKWARQFYQLAGSVDEPSDAAKKSDQPETSSKG